MAKQLILYTNRNIIRNIINSIIYSNDSVITELEQSKLIGLDYSIYPDGPLNIKYDKIHKYKIILPKEIPNNTKITIEKLDSKLKEVAIDTVIDLLNKKEITLITFRKLQIPYLHHQSQT